MLSLPSPLPPLPVELHVQVDPQPPPLPHQQPTSLLQPIDPSSPDSCVWLFSLLSSSLSLLQSIEPLFFSLSCAQLPSLSQLFSSLSSCLSPVSQHVKP